VSIQNNSIFIPLKKPLSEEDWGRVNSVLDQAQLTTTERPTEEDLGFSIPQLPEKELNDFIQELKKVGILVHTEKKNFPVTGMSCASCAIGAETTLSHQKGVLNAQVNFANAMARIEYLPGTNDPDHLKASLQDIGFDLIVEESSKAEGMAEEMREKAYQKLRRNTFLALIFATPVMVIGMFFMHMPYGNEIMWILTTPVLLIFGKQFFQNAWQQAKHQKVNMDTLVALSTGIAYVFSVFNMLWPSFWENRGLEAHVYFEAAAVIIAFILLGKLLEERAKSGTSTAIKNLMQLQPDIVIRVLEDGTEIAIEVEDVETGDVLVVKPGNKVPVDGQVISGQSYVDESMITGEPIAVLKNKGTKVYAGTINQKGSFQLNATGIGKETVLAKIIQMVQEAQASKAPVQKLVDRIASVFVPIVIGIAILSFVVWNIVGGDHAFTYGLLSMVTVLVIACPCALGLATPTALMVGIGRGAENGILIKDAEALEQAHQVNAIILDKTGTITEGRPQVISDQWKEGDADLFRSRLLGMERMSEHPLAEAVVQYLVESGVKEEAPDSFESITGKGIFGKFGQMVLYAGNATLLKEKGLIIPESWQEKVHQAAVNAWTPMFLFDAKEIYGAIFITDAIKPTSAKAIQKLTQAGIEVYLVTGDNETTANAVAKNVGINHVKSEMLPSDKAAFVADLQASGLVVAMVGDGINDSQALAQANVSIAMGKGSDIAMDVAKMTLISSDLMKIPLALNLSRKTVATIRQNLFWAFIYNVIGIPIAAGILYPFNEFLLNPMLAGAAMALSSVSVVSNSLRLKFKKI